MTLQYARVPIFNSLHSLLVLMSFSVTFVYIILSLPQNFAAVENRTNALDQLKIPDTESQTLIIATVVCSSVLGAFIRVDRREWTGNKIREK